MRRFQILPFEQKSKAVDISGVAINTATTLAVLAPPVEVGVERRFPSQIIGNFVVDQDMDHDFRAFPFTVKRCSKWEKNASARITEAAGRSEAGACGEILSRAKGPLRLGKENGRDGEI